MTSAESEDSQWKEAAEDEQIQNAGLFNKMDICSLDVLKTRIAICLFGLPEDLEEKYCEWDNLSYKQYKKQSVIENISKSILHHQKSSNEDKIYLSFVVVLGRRKTGKEKNFTDWVFNVPGKDGSNKIFIDRNGRVYQDWNDYLTTNTLPKATICFPSDGKYPDEGLSPRVDFADTPSCSVAKNVLFGFDVATSVTTMVGCGLGTAALFVPIAAPIVWTGLAITAAAGAYGAGRSIETLVDRGKHEETLSPLNSYARSAWLGATVPFLGIAAGTASAIAATARFANLGVQISQAGRVAINVTNGVNCVAHGVCFANDVYNIIETSLNGDQVSLIQIFQCIASLLLFTNAVVSSYQARLILQSLSSKETAGGIENLYARLSQSTLTENGICVRPTSVLTLLNLSSFISVAIPWGGMRLNIPPGICKSIENIFQFLLKNRNSEFTVIVSGIIPLLKVLWEKLQQQSKKHTYEYEWSPPSSAFGNFKTCQTRSFNVTEEATGPENVENDTDKITIAEMNLNGEKQQLQEIIQNILEEEQVSEFEVLQYSQLVFQRLKEEIEEKEKEFQTRCKKNKMDEKQLENILGIEGERSQYFANEVTKSCRGIKIIALKQDCRRQIEKEGIQIPLYSASGSPFKIHYFHSIQKQGTRAEKYLKILQKAGIKTSSKIHFPSENSYFIDVKDPQFTMAGVVNFTESDEDMKGIIIMVKNS